MIERPCDCACRHQRFEDIPCCCGSRCYAGIAGHGTRIVPAMHQHEDDRCSKPFTGIGGCPGLPHCRDWIIGCYRAGETIATVTGKRLRAWKLAEQRRELEREFERRPALTEGTVEQATCSPVDTTT